MCETALSKRERMELFIDIYANCLLRDKTDLYMQGVLPELIQLVTDDERCPSVLRNNVHFDLLRFKDRDELEDVISSYYSTHQFDIEKQHDQRKRFHFKERYDHRRNLYDWDFQMYVKECAPYIHPNEYKKWRETGLAFEWRLVANKIANRTYASYIPGYNVS
jgi:dynein assembly factor 3